MIHLDDYLPARARSALLHKRGVPYCINLNKYMWISPLWEGRSRASRLTLHRSAAILQCGTLSLRPPVWVRRPGRRACAWP